MKFLRQDASIVTLDGPTLWIYNRPKRTYFKSRVKLTTKLPFESVIIYVQKVLIRLCVLELPAQTRLPSDIPYMNAH